jgi:hypothetical protein
MSIDRAASIRKTDVVWWTAGVVAVIVIVESVYWMHVAPTYEPAKFENYRAMYEVAIRGTLLSLFTTLVSIKFAYEFGIYLVNHLRTSNE